jgi:hypothetical protein
MRNDLLVLRSRQRRIAVLARQFEEAAMRLLDRGLHRRRNAHGLTRAARHRRIGQIGIAVL